MAADWKLSIKWCPDVLQCSAITHVLHKELSLCIRMIRRAYIGLKKSTITYPCINAYTDQCSAVARGEAKVPLGFWCRFIFYSHHELFQLTISKCVVIIGKLCQGSISIKIFCSKSSEISVNGSNGQRGVVPECSNVSTSRKNDYRTCLL